jgi:hypothetical protein
MRDVGKIRVLMVDDTEAHLEGMRSHLERTEDFDLIGMARDGESTIALTKSQTEGPEPCLSFHSSPKKGGWGNHGVVATWRNSLLDERQRGSNAPLSIGRGVGRGVRGGGSAFAPGPTPVLMASGSTPPPRSSSRCRRSSPALPPPAGPPPGGGIAISLSVQLLCRKSVYSHFQRPFRLCETFSNVDADPEVG